MNANNDTTNGARRRDTIHKLWLLLIAVAVRNLERFEPTPDETAEIELLALRTGLTLGAVERLTDQARRFVQIQSELETIGDPLPAFNRAGIEIRKLTDEARRSALEWQHKIRPLEKQRCELGQRVVRAAALKAESETLQRQVAAIGVGNGD